MIGPKEKFVMMTMQRIPRREFLKLHRIREHPGKDCERNFKSKQRYLDRGSVKMTALLSSQSRSQNIELKVTMLSQDYSTLGVIIKGITTMRRRAQLRVMIVY